MLGKVVCTLPQIGFHFFMNSSISSSVGPGEGRGLDDRLFKKVLLSWGQQKYNIKNMCANKFKDNL